MSGSRFIIPNAQITMVEPKVAQSGTQYTKLHFTVTVTGRNGNTFPKQTSIACFDAVAASQIQPNGTYDIKGVVGVNKQGYLNLEFKSATPSAGAQMPQQNGYQQAPQQQPQQNVQQPPQQNGYGQMPQNPNQQPAQQSQVQHPPQQQTPVQNNGFDDDIPF